MKITIIVSLLLLQACNTPSEAFDFQVNYIDLAYGGNGKPDWVRSGDLDDDGDIDVIAGGGNALFVYEDDGFCKKYKKHGNLTPPNRSELMGLFYLI